MLSIMWSGGCVNTTGIENPGSGTLWPMVRALMEEHGLDGRLVYTVVHYCMYGAPYRKPTTIAHSPELGVDWARRCNQKGDCGAMSWIGGSFIHGSRGSFGLEHAGLPPGLADGLNHAWRAIRLATTVCDAARQHTRESWDAKKAEQAPSTLPLPQRSNPGPCSTAR